MRITTFDENELKRPTTLPMRIHLLVSSFTLSFLSARGFLVGNGRTPNRLSPVSVRLASSPQVDEESTPNSDQSDHRNDNREPQTNEGDKEAIGNLLANDEWDGLGMELSELVKMAVMEDLKANAREFLGKDDYKIGDISKEIDSRVKQEVANMRDKEEYELGDLVLALLALLLLLFFFLLLHYSQIRFS